MVPVIHRFDPLPSYNERRAALLDDVMCESHAIKKNTCILSVANVLLEAPLSKRLSFHFTLKFLPKLDGKYI